MNDAARDVGGSMHACTMIKALADRDQNKRRARTGGPSARAIASAMQLQASRYARWPVTFNRWRTKACSVCITLTHPSAARVRCQFPLADRRTRDTRRDLFARLTPVSNERSGLEQVRIGNCAASRALCEVLSRNLACFNSLRSHLHLSGHRQTAPPECDANGGK